MTLPKLSDDEYEEMYEDYVWFLSISTEFFDNMYGNIYNDYSVSKENKEYTSSEEDDEYTSSEEEEE